MKNAPPLPLALDAPCEHLTLANGQRLAYYRNAQAAGRPLVLIHSINAAPSSFEVKPLFDHFRGSRPVFSLDLPGFGQAGRGPADYSAEHYAAAIGQFLSTTLDQAADIAALSLSCEFAVRAALRHPELVRSLVLISPTGFGHRQPPPRPVAKALHGLLAGPPWHQPLFDLVASKRSIHYYLGKSFLRRAPEDMLDYAYATAHQPGARHAPLTFLSGQLFTRNARESLYGRLQQHPTLVLADRDPYVRFDALDEFVATRRNWSKAAVVPNMGLPHWEDPEKTAQTLETFWQETGSRSS